MKITKEQDQTIIDLEKRRGEYRVIEAAPGGRKRPILNIVNKVETGIGVATTLVPAILGTLEIIKGSPEVAVRYFALSCVGLAYLASLSDSSLGKK